MALVDDHPLMLAGLTEILRKQPAFSVTATGSSADDIFDIGVKLSPDVFIVDLMMPGNIFEVMAKLVGKIQTKILIFTAMTGSDYAVRALNAGASGYVLKGSSAQELLHAIATVHRGDMFITPSFACKVIEELKIASLKKMTGTEVKLSVREGQIIRMLLRGFTNRQIAADLQIGEKTVKNYMTILMQKLNARNRLEVLLAAQKLEDGTNPLQRH
ncbi:UNVERIFIED_ORG: DNA-binding NarL/FixJ family response regulator [Rhizobium etli]